MAYGPLGEAMYWPARWDAIDLSGHRRRHALAIAQQVNKPIILCTSGRAGRNADGDAGAVLGEFVGLVEGW